MANLSFDLTRHGVLVQVAFGDPTDDEWKALLDLAMRNRTKLKAVLIRVHGSAGPNSRQRQELAETFRHFPDLPTLPTALLSESRVTRGILTAVSWLTSDVGKMRSFAPDEVDAAQAFLGLDANENAAARELVRRLEERAREDSSAVGD